MASSKKRPNLAIHALELAKRQKKATIKDLREINSVKEGKREREQSVVHKDW